MVETDGDDDLSDKMWEANLKHGVQYSRAQRQTQGLKLHGRGLKAKEIAGRVGVSASSVYSWTKELREKKKQERNAEIERLRDEGKTQQEIADEVGIERSTVAKNVKDSRSGKNHKAPESESADIEPVTREPEPEALPLAEIPDHILKTARAVMVGFVESRPDGYLARLEVSASEWMTITDDSLSSELERELLTSAAAMCLWQEWMIWYQGERTGAFTNAFGEIGPVFVRGRSGQWRIVSRLRLILRRIWA